MPLSEECLENKDHLRPLRTPKTPELENKDPPLFYTVWGYSSPHYPRKNRRPGKSPFCEGGGGEAIPVIFHVYNNRNSLN